MGSRERRCLRRRGPRWRRPGRRPAAAAPRATPRPPRATIGPQRSNLPRATQPSQPPALEIAVPASDPSTTAKRPRRATGTSPAPAAAAPPCATARRADGHPGDGRRTSTTATRSPAPWSSNLPAAERLADRRSTPRASPSWATRCSRRSPSASPGDPLAAPRRRAPRRPRAAPRAAPSARTSSSTRTPCGASPAWPGSGPGDRVVEIGAGLGSLTLALAETGATVTAVEVDRDLVPVLREVVEPLGVRGGRGRRPRASTGRLARSAASGWVLVANLPYNVATPLVADLLDGVPGHRADAGDGAAGGGRAAGRRAGRRRLRRGVGEGRVLGRRPRSWARCPPTVFLPRPKVESALVAIAPDGRRRRSPPDVARRGCSRWCGPASGSGARCCAGRSPAWPRRRQLRRRRHPARGPGRGALDRGLGGADQGRRAGRLSLMPSDVVRAPAKLTLSLRVDGRPRRRLPPDRRRDGDARPGRRRSTFADGDGLDGRRARARPASPTGDDNLVRRALRAVGPHGRTCALDKRIPAGGGLGGGSADAAAVLRWAGCDDLDVAAALGADVPFCLVGGRARVRGIGEVLEPLPLEDRDVHAARPAASACRPPAVYRAWDELGGPRGDGPNDLEPAALVVEPRLAAWRDRLGEATGRDAGAGRQRRRPGSSRAPPRPGRPLAPRPAS